ncbi:MAG TPA: hypothetical protein VG206_13595 [Terriglobia bacterium]|nr:hypothetical protein [Terriglobia bacterium]
MKAQQLYGPRESGTGFWVAVDTGLKRQDINPAEVPHAATRRPVTGD